MFCFVFRSANESNNDPQFYDEYEQSTEYNDESMENPLESESNVVNNIKEESLSIDSRSEISENDKLSNYNNNSTDKLNGFVKRPLHRWNCKESKRCRNCENEDDVDLFMKSVAINMKQLPKHLIPQAKIQILSVISNLQYPITSDVGNSIEGNQKSL